ncbi:hypothetical protein [Streptosporangium sp. NPDC006007]|uniref:hypothetical protein n=1 Tax=Streptosporangium sp. NPDC006007 TaxID=3154575 RepID=UPI0033B0385B
MPDLPGARCDGLYRPLLGGAAVMSRAHQHCVACADPVRLAVWLAGQRERADAHAQQARELRGAAAEVRERLIAASVAAVLGDPQQDTADRCRERDDLDRERIMLCGRATVHAEQALFIRDRADRVEAAHPREVTS